MAGNDHRDGVVQCGVLHHTYCGSRDLPRGSLSVKQNRASQVAYDRCVLEHQAEIPSDPHEAAWNRRVKKIVARRCDAHESQLRNEFVELDLIRQYSLVTTS